MKKILISFLPLLILLFFNGCSNNSSGNGSNPVGIGGIGSGTGGGTGGSSVTFTVAIVHDQTNTNYFEFTPSTNIVVISITGSCAAANVNNQVVQGDGTTVYSNTSPFYVSLTGINVQSGQNWTFSISGKIGSSTGQDFTSNVNYTIP